MICLVEKNSIQVNNINNTQNKESLLHVIYKLINNNDIVLDNIKNENWLL